MKSPRGYSPGARTRLLERTSSMASTSRSRTTTASGPPASISSSAFTETAKRKVLGCFTKHGRENLEGWETVLRSLVERGLRRVRIVVHDDFSGLLRLTRGMFPNSDIQLCTVHMLRNAKTHLRKDDASEFTKRFRTIKNAWNAEVGATQFEELCLRFEKSAPAFVKELRKKATALPFLSRLPRWRPTYLVHDQRRRGHQQTTRDPSPQRRRILPFRGNRKTQTRYRRHLTRIREVATRRRIR